MTILDTVQAIGWLTIVYWLVKSTWHVFKAKESKDHSWYETPIFKPEETKNE